ncbi:MAG: transcriptional repressor [Clostridiales bacterium]|nr:transcriptional repressor [Clostridiales bacterium]
MDNKKVILELVLRSSNHPTADDIYQQLRSSGKKITLATVYNNLHALCKEGKIRCVSFDEKFERYDKPYRHDHLVCRCCGKISDISLDDITDMLSEQCGVRLESYDLKMFYRCADCRKKAADE